MEDGYDIFIKEKAVLNTLIDKAHDDSEVKNAKDKTESEIMVQVTKGPIGTSQHYEAQPQASHRL